MMQATAVKLSQVAESPVRSAQHSDLSRQLEFTSFRELLTLFLLYQNPSSLRLQPEEQWGICMETQRLTDKETGRLTDRWRQRKEEDEGTREPETKRSWSHLGSQLDRN